MQLFCVAFLTAQGMVQGAAVAFVGVDMSGSHFEFELAGVESQYRNIVRCRSESIGDTE